MDTFGLVGQRIEDTYLVERRVGEGGFGVVYRARDTVLDVPVAIKCLKVPPHFTAEVKSRFYASFLAEARLLAKLCEHPAIVRVLRFGQLRTTQHGSVPYLVLEWLQGQDLEQALSKGTSGWETRTEEQAVALLLPAIEAIGFAHSLGIAHRDIKPPNLFVLQGGVPSLKVLDFGIAKVMQEGDKATQASTRTTSAFPAFSPIFGAPEQFHPKEYGASGPWTDVHALGLVLSTLVSGRYGLGADHGECFVRATAPVRPTPRAFGVPTSDGFEQILQRALALHPRDRFETARELHRALLQWLEAQRSARGAPCALGYAATTPAYERPALLEATVRSATPPARITPTQTFAPSASHVERPVDANGLPTGGEAVRARWLAWPPQIALAGGLLLGIGAVLALLSGVLLLRWQRPAPVEGVTAAARVEASALATQPNVLRAEGAGAVFHGDAAAADGGLAAHPSEERSADASTEPRAPETPRSDRSPRKVTSGATTTAAPTCNPNLEVCAP